MQASKIGLGLALALAWPWLGLGLALLVSSVHAKGAVELVQALPRLVVVS